MTIPLLPNVVRNLDEPNLLRQQRVDLYNYHMAVSNQMRLSACIGCGAVATGVALVVAAVVAYVFPLMVALQLGTALIAGTATYYTIFPINTGGKAEEAARLLLNPAFWRAAVQANTWLANEDSILLFKDDRAFVAEQRT